MQARKNEKTEVLPARRLSGKSVWLTRPAGQARELRAKLEDLGASILHLPLLEIVGLPLDESGKSLLAAMDQQDFLFFVSPNAVQMAMPAIAAYWPHYPPHIVNFAPGFSTAALLNHHGLAAAYPLERMDSEGLLALPVLQDIKGQRILILRGQGGRKTLAQGLKARGAVVEELALYRRQLPFYDPDYLRTLVEAHVPEAIVITSGEALENFMTLSKGLWPRHGFPMLHVSSQRICRRAKELGFQSLAVMKGADDGAIIHSLSEEHGVDV